MKDFIAFLIALPFLVMIGKAVWKFYYQLGVRFCRMLNPATPADNGGRNHAGGLQVRSGHQHGISRDS